MKLHSNPSDSGNLLRTMEPREQGDEEYYYQATDMSTETVGHPGCTLLCRVTRLTDLSAASPAGYTSRSRGGGASLSGDQWCGQQQRRGAPHTGPRAHARSALPCWC